MSALGENNLSYDKALSQLEIHLSGSLSYYGGLNVRCVSILQGEVWRNLVCIIRAEPSASRIPATGSRRYDMVHLLEETLSVSQLQRFLIEMPTGTITVDSEKVFVGEQAALRHWQMYPSKSDYSDFPGYLYQSNQSSSVYPGQIQEPLVQFGLPYYADVTYAVHEWVQLRRFHRWSDARLGYVWIFLPECRARFSDLKPVGRRLRIAIARGAHEQARKFHVQGSWEIPHGHAPVDLVVEGAAETEIPKGATAVDLYLVDETNTTFDYHRETPYWTQGLGRILPSSQQADIPLTDEYLTLETPEASSSRRVFIVHGRDETNVLRLDRMLREQFGLEPVILRYQAGKGRTLIEKFEEEAAECSFAFVLLGPDDQVRVPKGHGEAEEYTQARPNVVFEAGWFYGRLGRAKVSILHKRGARIHSDLEGISRIPFDDNVEAVFLDIKRELESGEII